MFEFCNEFVFYSISFGLVNVWKQVEYAVIVKQRKKGITGYSKYSPNSYFILFHYDKPQGYYCYYVSKEIVVSREAVNLET